MAKKKSTTRKAAPKKQSTTRKAATKKSATKKSATKKSAIKKSATKKALAKKAVAKKKSPTKKKKVATKKAATKKSAIKKKAATKKAATKKKAAPKKAAAKKVATKKKAATKKAPGKRKAPAKNKAPIPGAAYAFPLADGRFGLCRVLRVEEDAPLVEACAWIGAQLPELTAPGLREPLLLTHHAFLGRPERAWCEPAVPEDFVYLGVLPPSADERSLEWDTHASWEGFAYQRLAQWRWDHEREEVLREELEEEERDLEAAHAQERAGLMPTIGEFVSVVDALGTRRAGSKVPAGIPIRHEAGYHTDQIGALAETGEQVAAFVVASLPSTRTTAWKEHKWWYAVVHRFDATGVHLETVARFAGRSADGEALVIQRARTYLSALLNRLPPLAPRDVFAGLFAVEVHGRTFGLVDASEPDEDYEGITLVPNDLAFFPPYDGSYDT